MFQVRYRFVFILALSVYSYLNIRYTVGDRLFDFEVPSFALFGLLAAVVTGVWELNRIVQNHLDKLYRLVNQKIHPLIILFIFSVLNVALVCFITMEALYPLIGLPIRVDTSHLTLLMAFGFRVNLFLNCINAIVYYMDKLKKTQVEAEQLKKITAEAQFESLRNQINPHFLFNCFNVLSSLVYKDADTSAKFISQLSNVYRYLLYSQDKKIVTLKEELEFLESYIFLLKIRFGDNIVIVKSISCDTQNYYLPPVVMQMLIENAIKHNVVSKKSPLEISIYAQDNQLTVTNNLQLKELKEESTQIGLDNIRNRYLFLSGKPIIIEKSASHFSVRVPLLEIENT